MSKKSTPGPSYDGLKKIGQNALSVTLFKQLSRAKIGPKFKNFGAHQIANDQKIVLSKENPQKVHSRPKLWAFTMGFHFHCVLFLVISFQTPPSKIPIFSGGL